MGTINNAKIYSLDDKLGSLEEGKFADLVIIDTDQAHWQPLHDPYSQIVYSMQPGDILTTVINGKVIMEDRQVLTVKEEEFTKSIGILGQKINSGA